MQSHILLLVLLSISSLTLTLAAVRLNPRQLAQAALNVSAVRASQTSTYVSRFSSSSGGTPKPSARSARGGAAFQDCVMMMTDSANRLKQAAGEMTRLGRAGSPQFALCMSNIQTWVSAALTDHNMCLSSLSQVRAAETAAAAAAIRKKVVEVSQVTSNALSLVNKITA